jgi:hypothetical protein
VPAVAESGRVATDAIGTLYDPGSAGNVCVTEFAIAVVTVEASTEVPAGGQVLLVRGTNPALRTADALADGAVWPNL